MESYCMKDLQDMQDKFVSAAKEAMSGGIENLDAGEMGAVIDMIKDLAEAKKDCAKACYYETVVEAMNDSSERYGYKERMIPLYDEHENEVAKRWRMGYREPEHERYGIAYEDYKQARKHYTETKSATDKEEMERHIREHVSDMTTTMMDIYNAAEPELRKRIKADISKLCADMT